ncbi:VTT domain-containing protein [Nocardioides sp. SYSU D00038]|uniref:DedA family protein n=1 Tax=Nocardioides sp. SYSU D00038 TaxID=2812554 RepID=UPI0027DE0120|nr:VTT domain-containing protein [Nocardioides sp. SYSU D00038]
MPSIAELQPWATSLLLGIDYLDPEWLLDRFGTQFFWVCLIIIFVECGLFFPFLPGDSLLFALGIFIATGQIDQFPGTRLVEMLLAMTLLLGAAWLGNAIGYEIGRGIGPPLRQRDGRLLKRKYLDNTERFFAEHGNKALVIGRFIAFVRTYITVVAGVTRMDRGRFYFWSLVGGVLWVVSITSLGYFLGDNVPWLQSNIDLAILAILAFTAVPIVIEWWRHRHHRRAESAGTPVVDGPVVEAPVRQPGTDEIAAG